MSTIVVVNPNSNRAITAEIDGALADLRRADGPAVRCLTLPQGPLAIETDDHVAMVAEPLAQLVRDLTHEADAFVIACFSDPGLAEARGVTSKPVLGIARAGLLTALALTPPIGVLSLGPGSVRRHQVLYDALGIRSGVAADLPVGLAMAQLADSDRAWPRLRETARDLVARGARTLVPGCTGMGRYRGALAEEVGVPVVDPTVAAVAMAMGLVPPG